MTKRQANRYEEIMSLLEKSERQTVADIVRALHASPATVRRDLDYLEQKGIIIRTHGGAMLRQPGLLKPPYVERMQRNEAEKTAIARRAAELIKNHETIWISSGTTSYQLARVLGSSDLDVIAITNAIDVAMELARNPQIQVMVTGGELGESYGIGGQWTLSMLENLPAPDKAFIGVDAISLERGVTSYRAVDATIHGIMAERTREAIIIADSSKFGVTRMYQMIALKDVDVIVTDDRLPDDTREAFSKVGVNVLSAQVRDR